MAQLPGPDPMRKHPTSAQADAPVPPVPPRLPVVPPAPASRRQRRVDRRELRRVMQSVEQQRLARLWGVFTALAAEAEVVTRIVLVEHQPGLRVVRIDFETAPSLLVCVDAPSLGVLAATRVPVVICFRRASNPRGQWLIELATLDRTIRLRASEVAVVEGDDDDPEMFPPDLDGV